MGEKWKQWETLFSWAPKSLQMVTAAMKLKVTCSLKEKLWPTQTTYYKADIILPKSPSSQNYGFSSSHVRMWELDHKEGWVPKNWSFWTAVLKKTVESPLDCKQIEPVSPKGNQSWIFIGRIDAEAPILWPPDGKNWLIGKDPDARKDWSWEEKGLTEDEMVGWNHQLNGHASKQTKLQETVKDREAWHAAVHGLQRVRHNLMTEQ